METDPSADLPVLLKQIRWPLALALVGISLVLASFYFTGRHSRQNIQFSQTLEASSSAFIVVHLSGAVAKPGLYQLPVGARLNEAIAQAGGLTDEADADFIDKTLNLAAIVKDGAKIYIPRQGEKNQSSAVAGTVSINGLISINSASKIELETLPDIGSVRAQKIIDNRPYQTLEELVEKKVVSQSIFDKIKDKITLY